MCLVAKLWLGIASLIKGLFSVKYELWSIDSIWGMLVYKAKKTLVENPLKKCSGLNQVRLNPNINHKIKYKIKKLWVLLEKKLNIRTPFKTLFIFTVFEKSLLIKAEFIWPQTQ